MERKKKKERERSLKYFGILTSELGLYKTVLCFANFLLNFEYS